MVWNAVHVSSIVLAFLPPVFPFWTENITLENCLRKQNVEKVPSIQHVIGGYAHFSHGGFDSLWAESKPAPVLQCSKLVLMIVLIVVHSRYTFSSQWKPQRKHNRTLCQGQINDNEMEISGCLRAQIGEHDEMKKNSLTLFCLLKICSTSRNTNIFWRNASYCIWSFFYHNEKSNNQENILDVELIQAMLPSTSVYTSLHCGVMYN